MSELVTAADGIDISRPRWDQDTFSGRARHFFVVTNPLNLLKSSQQLDHARDVISKYKKGDIVSGLTKGELWRQKYIYDSAFHPDTGEKMTLIGRMSAQVPMNMTITGCMMTFYKTTPAVIFWQWINQSFNAIVNYTNRSGDQPIPVNQLGISYVCATGGALVTALGLNATVKNLPPLFGRFVPFAAVAAANCINIPMMRRRELNEGIPVFTPEGERLGDSVVAAKRAIPMVVFSRIAMCIPGMSLPPLLMDRLERRGTLLRRFPWANAPIQVTLCGLCLLFATPLCCAIFPQQSSIPFDSLEPPLQRAAASRGLGSGGDRVSFNKGL